MNESTEDLNRAAHRAHASSRHRKSAECMNEGHMLCGEPASCACFCHDETQP